MDDMIDTNIGLIPKEDFLDIKAMQYGFESYEDMIKSGYDFGDDNLLTDLADGRSLNINDVTIPATPTATPILSGKVVQTKLINVGA